MPLKRQADEKERAWRRVYRQRYRERLCSTPRTPMHPKNDPKSDRICEHCDAVRAGASEDGEMNASLKPVRLLSSDEDSAKAHPSLTDLRSMFNGVSVQQNSNIHTLTNPSVIDDRTPREVAIQASNETIRALGVRPHHNQRIVESIEKEPSSSLPQTPPATPLTGFLDKQERIELKQRLNRSHAPSPEACEMGVQWSRIPSPDLCRASERRYSSRSERSLTTALPIEVNNHREPLKRDPRLDLNFVLGTV
ncbi:hypothetical protein LTR70_009456 [Exophiala xenobiotica]|uniref:Uncharacterized protein n=1 Tax=Lithohypha guttulata TaxID=1690604 RepID=A0ABR0JXL5_9EURO|nr:hypothetical protein LTR24_009225 [Lithohypha guttulata]KAK5310464.1 hypothetical protein LTR70_009456 [Exophiala xenobiotica]